MTAKVNNVIPGLNRCQSARVNARHPLRGRSVAAVTRSSAKHWMIITGIFLMVFGLIFLSSMAYAQPVCLPKESKPLSFSKNLSQYNMIKGARLTPSGGEACGIETPPLSHHDCMAHASREKARRSGIKPSDHPSFHEKGLLVRGNPEIRIFINPQKMENYKKALDYAEKAIVQNSHFYELSDRAIVEIFKKIHQILMENLPLPARATPPGTFRKVVMVVSELNPETFTKSLARKIKKIATAEEIAIIERSLIKSLDYQDGSFDWLRNLSLEERKVWEKFLIICPMPEEIEERMMEAVGELKRLYHAEEPPTALSSFIHCKIGFIHPFSDGNGREAIILLQSFLKKGLDEELVIQDVETYDKMAMEDVKLPGTFRRHLEKVLIPWTQRYRKELGLDLAALLECPIAQKKV